jgi:hypothetical protein
MAHETQDLIINGSLTCGNIRTVEPCAVGQAGSQDTTLAARFWSKVDRKSPSECWPWLAHVSSGYGRFKVAGKYRQASAIAWELAHGRKLPASRLIRHTCDYSRCVNPAHLRASTQKHNVHDAMRKGRHCLTNWPKAVAARKSFDRKDAA